MPACPPPPATPGRHLPRDVRLAGRTAWSPRSPRSCSCSPPASGLPTISVGDSTSLHLGDPVTAMGNAFGRGGAPSVTRGSVTALHRSIVARNPAGCTSEHLTDVIQTGAEIHPGDSGGALLNA